MIPKFWKGFQQSQENEGSEKDGGVGLEWTLDMGESHIRPWPPFVFE